MLKLLGNLSEDQANTYGIVLSSSDISYQMRKERKGWCIWVNEENEERALNAIEQYLEENKDVTLKDETFGHAYQRTFTGLWAAIILLACYIAPKSSDDIQVFIRAYGSSAFHILHGELFRTATSLLLHANALHLAGNMIGIALFGTAVCTITGWGVGWLMIFATGILGNLVNAFLYKTSHLSIGASTAVFGAIGTLAAHQFFKKFRLPGQRIKAWLPLGGGLALLGFLGSGQHVDLTAHLFGFMAGIMMGLLYAVFMKRPASKRYQMGCLLITLGILALSWMRALTVS